MSYFYQIYTGNASGRGVTLEDIMRALPDSRYIRALIVGWSQDVLLYRRLRKYADERKIQLWLWFPVFSEHGAHDAFRRQINIRDNAPFAAKTFDGDEAFDFCCPSHMGITDALLSLYDSVYSDVAFDGVFLDRIRYPSMTVGVEALFGCFCGDCRAWMAERGITEREMRECYARIRAKIDTPECDNPLGIKEYRNGGYRFSDSTLSTLIQLKCERITDALRDLTQGFRARGLRIGMDLFAPFLAPMVGQDYLTLGAMADFVKPMLYRNTYTPAGIAFETDAMARAISGGSEELYRRRRAFLQELYGNDLYAEELNAVRCAGEILKDENRFIPGIEIHTAGGSRQIGEESIRSTVELIEAAGFSNRVACWDILSADKTAVESFIGCAGGERT